MGFKDAAAGHLGVVRSVCSPDSAPTLGTEGDIEITHLPVLLRISYFA